MLRKGKTRDPWNQGFNSRERQKDILGKWYYELNCVPHKTYVEVLISGTSKYDLIWKWSLCRCNQVKMRSYWIRVGPKFYMHHVFIIRGNYEHTEVQRLPYEDGGRDWSDAFTNQRTPRIACILQKLGERHGTNSSFVSLLPTHWFWTSSLQNCERINFCF